MTSTLHHAVRIAGHSDTMVAKVEYVLNTFGQIYNWWDFESIQYDKGEDGGIYIFQSPTDIYSLSRGIRDAEMIIDDDLPILFHNGSTQPLVFHDDHIEFTYDFFAASFYFLSGWQEYVCERKDHYGRFPYKESIQSRYAIVMKPVVNYYFEMLCDALERITGKRPVSDLWEGHSFGYHLSHDIDQCLSGWSSEVKFAMKEGAFIGAAGIVVNKLFGKDPYFNLSKIVEGEIQRDVTSTFFFLPERKTYQGITQADYDISDRHIQEQIELIIEKGSQVMLHGSAGSSESVSDLKENLTRLGRPAEGNRFHFLCWSQKDTPSILEETNFKFDSTLGFAEHIGYRNGICHPFYLYDIENDRSTNVLEYPLMIMDTTFYNRNYMSSDKSEVISLVKELLNESMKFKGIVSVLWHNNYFAKYKYAGWGELYWSIIDLFKEYNGKSILLEEVYSTDNNA